MWKERQVAEIDPPYGELLCPDCRGNYLHQANTTIYQRAEDAPYTTVIAQDGHEVVATKFPSGDTHNPSSRRHGLIIEFWCENCHAGDDDKAQIVNPHRLAIFQHKGNTYLEWVK
jgi:hypothetical protein